MTPTFSIRAQTCPNQSCTHYQQQSQNNIVIHTSSTRRLRCTTCKATWVDRKQTPYYRLRTPPEKIKTFEELYEQGQSIREMAHTMNASTSTIQRWKKRFTY